MDYFFHTTFQQLSRSIRSLAIAVGLLLAPNLWAIQDAMVTSEQAVVYADELMTSPIGFVRKGKKIKLGNTTRNKSQVYPMIVSGKIAYISVKDVSTERASMESNRLVAERFQKGTEDEYKKNYSLSLFNFSSAIGADKSNGELKDKDAVNWYGASIRGSAQFLPRADLDILFNVMTAKQADVVFRAVELGLGVSLLVAEIGRLKIKAPVQFLFVPFASYALADLWRVNGFGFSSGAGLNAAYRLGRGWNLEAYGGLYYTKLSGFSPPEPYNSVDPSFIGSRIGLGVNYQF